MRPLVTLIALLSVSIAPIGASHGADHAHPQNENEGVSQLAIFWETPSASWLPTQNMTSSSSTFIMPSCGRGIMYVDTDGDGILDFRDPDMDNDYVSNEVESFLTNSDMRRCDTDGDGALDPLDLFANLARGVKLTMKLKYFKNLDDGLDCCPHTPFRWGDPYFSVAAVRLIAGAPPIADFRNIPGFNVTSHPHDAEIYLDCNSGGCVGDLKDSVMAVALPDDVRSYAEPSAYNFPAFELSLQIKDHDNIWDDSLYDIDPATGAQTTYLLTRDLLNLAIKPTVAGNIEANGGEDGVSAASAVFRFELRVNVNACSVEAAMRILRDGDTFVTLPELPRCQAGNGS